MKFIKACGKNKINVVKQMIENGANVNKDEELSLEIPLNLAASNGYRRLCEILILNGANIESADEYNEMTPLMHAAYNGHANVCKLLIKYGANIDAVDCEGHTAKQIALLQEHSDVVQVFKQNIKRKYEHNSIFEAIKAGDKELCETFLEKGACVNVRNYGSDKETPLTDACYYGHYDICKMLIEKGANVNLFSDFGDNSGWTPLMYAAMKYKDVNKLEICKLLIANGADPNLTKDSDAQTPLSFAAESGDRELCEFLLDNGADINYMNNKKTTALSCSVVWGHYDLTKFFLSRGADVNGKSYGETPLMNAVYEGNKEICELLIENGADVNIRKSKYIFSKSDDEEDHQEEDNEGVTALGMANEEGHSEIKDLLIAHGAIV
jgi:ankyrin repeat protein